jgi:hypothetical protein
VAGQYVSGRPANQWKPSKSLAGKQGARESLAGQRDSRASGTGGPAGMAGQRGWRSRGAGVPASHWRASVLLAGQRFNAGLASHWRPASHLRAIKSLAFQQVTITPASLCQQVTRGPEYQFRSSKSVAGYEVIGRPLSHWQASETLAGTRVLGEPESH